MESNGRPFTVGTKVLGGIRRAYFGEPRPNVAKRPFVKRPGGPSPSFAETETKIHSDKGEKGRIYGRDPCEVLDSAWSIRLPRSSLSSRA